MLSGMQELRIPIFDVINQKRTTDDGKVQYAKSIETDAQTVASAPGTQAPLWVEPAGEARN